MSEGKMFQEAVEAIIQGDRTRAKDILSRLLRTDKENPEYWIWMSSVVDSSGEQIYCLQTALRLDPSNQTAKQGLILLGELSPEDKIEVEAPVRRLWEVDVRSVGEAPPTGIRAIIANPIVRMLGFIGASVLVVGLILAGIFGSRGSLFRPRLTITPIAWTETPTNTPTLTPLVRSPTPTLEEWQPLWMMLEATYTPIPAYVNTPHPRIESYRAGLRAYERGDYDAMLDFMRQAAREEPDTPDTVYYIGEAYRLMGDYEQALQFYGDALGIDPSFAPAYLGRALARWAINPGAGILDDIDLAIEFDPDFGLAYLERVAYLLGKREADEALIDLETAEELISYDPVFYMYRAQAMLLLDENDLALQDALKAHRLDVTLLPAYLVLGQAYLANGQPEKALENLNTYSRYEEEDATFLAVLGQAYYFTEDYDEAIEILNLSLEMDDEDPIANRYLGLTYLATGEVKQAINALYVAKNLAPDSFGIGLDFGIALMFDERLEDALSVIDSTEILARNDNQLASVYYYRAQLSDLLGDRLNTEENYRLLLELPSRAVPRNWVVEAKAYLEPTSTPTVTYTPSSTYTITPTPTPSATPTFTLTPTPTNTNTPTFTVTPSPTPTTTPSPSVTNTPLPTATTTPSLTITITPSPTWTASPTITITPLSTWTTSPTITVTPSPTP